ncbi:MAG: spermidine synthase [Coriobacteriales bacterium]|jgi:spermidine synthase
MSVVTIVVAICMAVAIGIAVYLWWRQRSRTTLSFKTQFGTARVYTILQDERTGLHQANPGDGTPEIPIRVLELGGTLQSATFLDERCYDLVFDYFRCFNRVFELPFEVGSVLMLGGGGYAWPKYVISHYPEVHMDVVEIDPVITSIAKRYFYLDRLIVEFETEETGRLELICDDARHYLETSGATYDVIVNDCFAGNDIQGPLDSPEVVKAIKEHLSPGGVYAANVISALKGKDARVIALAETLKAQFAHVWCLPCSDRPLENMGNNVVFATDGPYRFRGAIELLGMQRGHEKP